MRKTIFKNDSFFLNGEFIRGRVCTGSKSDEGEFVLLGQHRMGTVCTGAKSYDSKRVLEGDREKASLY